MGGCFVDTMIPYPAGAPITITTTLAFSQFVLHGHVAYCVSGQGFGVRFDALDDDLRRRLAAFLGEAKD